MVIIQCLPEGLGSGLAEVFGSSDVFGGSEVFGGSVVVVDGSTFGAPSLSPSSSSSERGAFVQAGPCLVVVVEPTNPQPVRVVENIVVHFEDVGL
jgi:hypothetical protein